MLMAGVSPKFSAIDVLHALLILTEKPVSRQDAVSILRIGEGSVRSVFEELKQKGWAVSSRAGHAISEKGSGLKKEILKRISLPKMIKCSLFRNYYSSAVAVYKPDSDADPLLLRDLALKWGADGAMIVAMSKGALSVPKCDPATDLSEINAQLRIPEGGIAVITFADSVLSSQTSTLAVAISADSSLRELFLKNFVQKNSPLPIPL